VDAALDERNQAAAARLLSALCRSRGCQVLAVSHGAAFVAACDGMLRVEPATAAAGAPAASEAPAPSKAAKPRGGSAKRAKIK
jgi:ABC-type Mn2+/Zn2+ transport system ATPase subunit